MIDLNCPNCQKSTGGCMEHQRAGAPVPVTHTEWREGGQAVTPDDLICSMCREGHAEICRGVLCADAISMRDTLTRERDEWKQRAEAAENRLPCGHFGCALIDDRCGRPEHRYCAVCQEGECNAGFEETAAKVLEERDALAAMVQEMREHWTSMSRTARRIWRRMDLTTPGSE